MTELALKVCLCRPTKSDNVRLVILNTLLRSSSISLIHDYKFAHEHKDVLRNGTYLMYACCTYNYVWLHRNKQSILALMNWSDMLITVYPDHDQHRRYYICSHVVFGKLSNGSCAFSPDLSHSVVFDGVDLINPVAVIYI